MIWKLCLKVREAHTTNYAQMEEFLRKKKDAITRLFSPDYSGILLTTMVMQAVAERIIEITGM